MSKEKVKADFAFGKINYTLMLSGLGMIILGFFLMSGGGTKDPNVFSEEVFSPLRITVAPLLVLAGFATGDLCYCKKS
jgi:hypothetical protein